VLRLGHVPALDALRGVAILLVLMAHMGGENELLPGGRLGVDLFFVLSGFLITSLLLTEWSEKGKVSLRAFYRRRALRLVPALLAMLAAYVAVSGVLSLFGRTDTVHTLTGAALGALYLINLASAFFEFDAPPGLGHLWSLGQEEQFYLLWPPVLLATLWLRARPQILIVGLYALIVALGVWKASLIFDDNLARRFYAPDTHSDPILIGCLAGLGYSFGRIRRLPATVVWPSLAVTILVIATLVEPNARHHLFTRPIFAFAAAALILACVLEPGSRFVQLVNVRLLRGLGRISYGLYLWHLPIFALVGWKFGLPASIAVALLSYRYVELPFLRRKRRATSTSAAVPRLEPGGMPTPQVATASP
jgi:peptidoglycan/LPS O-acetylase OafA/YrhL